MIVAQPLETCASRAWEDARPDISIVVATHGRASYLPELLDALCAQTGRVEVVIADDGSPDETWSVLQRRVAAAGLPMLALRLSANGGPSVPRNTCVAWSRAPWLAFTDDDCLPSLGWVSGLVGAAAADVTVVQGRTEPEPGGWGGPWGRTLRVTRITGLFETANLACPRTAFDAVGGFAASRLLTGRAFGEDVLLGTRLAERGRVAFAEHALVHHRVLPATYRQFVAERERLVGFPPLARQVPQLRDYMVARVFLSRHTMAVDAALVSLAAAAVVRRPVLVAGALPWARRSWQAAADRPGRPRLVRAAQVAAADVVGAAALVRGSIRARRVVL